MPQRREWNRWVDVDYIELRVGDLYRWSPDGDLRVMQPGGLGKYLPFVGPVEPPWFCAVCGSNACVRRVQAIDPSALDKRGKNPSPDIYYCAECARQYTEEQEELWRLFHHDLGDL
jgi:hypothetical protein